MNYKRSIRRKIEMYQEQNEGVTLCKIAYSLEIEPSYLSRFLSGGSAHFSDELLYRLLRAIDLPESEIDYILLAREYERAENPERKKYLELKLKVFQINGWQQELGKLRQQLFELAQMMNDHCPKA